MSDTIEQARDNARKWLSVAAGRLSPDGCAAIDALIAAVRAEAQREAFEAMADGIQRIIEAHHVRGLCSDPTRNTVLHFIQAMREQQRIAAGLNSAEARREWFEAGWHYAQGYTARQPKPTKKLTESFAAYLAKERT